MELAWACEPLQGRCRTPVCSCRAPVPNLAFPSGMKDIQKPPGGVRTTGQREPLGSIGKRQRPTTLAGGRGSGMVQPSLTTGLWEDGGNAEIKVAT